MSEIWFRAGMLFLAISPLLIAAGANIPGARLPKAKVVTYQPPAEQFSRRAAVYADWTAIRSAVPVWPEPVSLPEWNRPVIVPLERMRELELTVRRIAAARLTGRTVLSAWSPRAGELPPPPAELAAALARIASMCDGFALAYHRSGAHIIRPEAGEMAFFAAAVRAGNPKIALFGEAYFGELAIGRDNQLAITAPPGLSGVLLCNAARPTAMTGNLISEVATATGLPVVLVVPDTFAEKYKDHQPVLIIGYDPQNN
ncbi:MAG: hypothetical protein HPZ91_07265 [Lentisphaeria bacterium]|nr:hypothetical protein [Lentisphaeria bacterium]